MPRFGKVDMPEFQFLAFEASQKGRKSIACPVLYLSVGTASHWGIGVL